MTAAVVQPSTVSLPAASDSVTVNSTVFALGLRSPSVTDTVAVPVSVIVVVAGVVLYSAVTVPAVLAPVRVTISVSPRSSTRSEVVWIESVVLDALAVMVNEPLGAV